MDTTSDAVVECYSGHTYAQEPRAFRLADQRRTVTMVHRRWREPAGPCFEVLADDAHVYVLVYNEITDSWDVSAKAGCRKSALRPDSGQITLCKEDGR